MEWIWSRDDVCVRHFLVHNEGMMMRKTPVNLTTQELELLVNLLNRHVTVAQYSSGFRLELKNRLQNLLDIAKELEPIDTSS